MKEKITRIALATAGILLIPLALQLAIGTGVDGQGFNWKLDDFVVMGALIFSAGLVYALLSLKVNSKKYRVIFGVVIAMAFLLTWAELAVGLFGTSFAGS